MSAGTRSTLGTKGTHHPIQATALIILAVLIMNVSIGLSNSVLSV